MEEEEKDVEEEDVELHKGALYKEVKPGFYEPRDQTGFGLYVESRCKWGWACVHETWAIIFDHVTKKWPNSTCTLHTLQKGNSCLEVTVTRRDGRSK